MIFSDFFEFIRFKIGVFLACMGMIGYLMFNTLSFEMFFVFAVCFFVTTGTYSYNNTKDGEEDLVNRKRTNPFIESGSGNLVVFVLFLSAFVFSIFLGYVTFLICTFGIVSGIIYSFFKLKKYFLVKNLYTGFGAGLSFLLGTLSFGADVILYYFLFSFLIFIGSVISDLRDYEGDKKIGIKTIPITIGSERSRKAVIIMLIAFSLSTIFLWKVLTILPFSAMMIYFMSKNSYKKAHNMIGFSLVFTMVFFLF